MFTKKFLLSLLERGLKTVAQAAAALLIADGTGLLETDWLQLLSISGMAGLISVLVNIGIGAGTDGGPSIGNIEEIAPSYASLPAPEDYTEDDTTPRRQAPTGGLIVGPDETDPPVG